MANLQKLGAMSAFIKAGIYIAMFVFFGAYWNYPANSDAAGKMAYIADHSVAHQIVNGGGYILFGIVLAVLVLALHERLKADRPLLSRYASIFGLVWVGLVIAAGMLANVGLNAALEQATKDPEQALATLKIINLVVEGIGGGNELVGGFWMMLLSIAALPKALPKSLCYFGMFAGAAGVATVYPAEVLTENFGISQIVWFIWLGVALLRKG